MYYAYILINQSRTKRYKGHCQDLAERIKEHNRGKTKSIKGDYWNYEYYEHFDTRVEAMNREKYWKCAAGRRWINTNLGRLKNPDSDPDHIQ